MINILKNKEKFSDFVGGILENFRKLGDLDVKGYRELGER
jgi:hypothetical protein